MVHRHDDVHKELDPHNTFNNGVIKLEDASRIDKTTSRTGWLCFTKDGNLYNVHPIQTCLDGPAIGYGVRWQVDKWEREELGV